MEKPFRVGITGGIGSGKSVVSRILRTFGYPVYDSDTRARELMDTDTGIRQNLIATFGNESYDSQGKLNRGFLAERIFGNPADRERMNAIVHPVVRADFATWVNHQSSELVFQESALLIETGGYKLLDATILVVAPVEERVRRVMRRDQTDQAAVRARIESQMKDAEKLPVADYVIHNDGRLLVIPQVLEILHDLPGSGL